MPQLTSALWEDILNDQSTGLVIQLNQHSATMRASYKHPTIDDYAVITLDTIRLDVLSFATRNCHSFCVKPINKIGLNYLAVDLKHYTPPFGENAKINRGPIHIYWGGNVDYIRSFDKDKSHGHIVLKESGALVYWRTPAEPGQSRGIEIFKSP